MRNKIFSFLRSISISKPLIFGALFSVVGSYTVLNNKRRNYSLFCEEEKPKKMEYFEEVDLDDLKKQYPNLTVLNSKAADMLIGLIRDKTINNLQFRNYARRIIRLLIEETLATECKEIVIKESPLGLYKAPNNSRPLSDYVAISILRSGNSMLEELLQIVPEVSVGYILVQRDEGSYEKKPIFFFEKLPRDITNKKIFLLDPMLGTGGSASASIEILKKKGIPDENIVFINLISCPTGLRVLFNKYPKMKIITAKVDSILLPNSKYIAPGIGDFGDRYYGTTH